MKVEIQSLTPRQAFGVVVHSIRLGHQNFGKLIKLFAFFVFMSSFLSVLTSFKSITIILGTVQVMVLPYVAQAMTGRSGQKLSLKRVLAYATSGALYRRHVGLILFLLVTQSLSLAWGHLLSQPSALEPILHRDDVMSFLAVTSSPAVAGVLLVLPMFIIGAVTYLALLRAIKILEALRLSFVALRKNVGLLALIWLIVTLAAFVLPLTREVLKQGVTYMISIFGPGGVVVLAIATFVAMALTLPFLVAMNYLLCRELFRFDSSEIDLGSFVKDDPEPRRVIES